MIKVDTSFIWSKTGQMANDIAGQRFKDKKTGFARYLMGGLFVKSMSSRFMDAHDGWIFISDNTQAA